MFLIDREIMDNFLSSTSSRKFVVVAGASAISPAALKACMLPSVEQKKSNNRTRPDITIDEETN
jgi:hypothetical protein